MPRGRATEDTLASLAARLARAGNRNAPDLLALAADAAAAAQTREAASSHDDALVAVVRALSRLGDHHAAEQIAMLVEGWDAKVSAIISAAEGARASNPQDAQRLFDEAVKLVDAPVSERRMQFFRDISVIGQKNLVDRNMEKDRLRRKRVLAEKLAAAKAPEHAEDAEAIPLGDDPIAALAALASQNSASRYEIRRPTDVWLEVIARWTNGFERMEAGRGQRVLASALDAAGWIRPDWAQVSRIVSGGFNSVLPPTLPRPEDTVT
jgi:hypothetical protein